MISGKLPQPGLCLLAGTYQVHPAWDLVPGTVMVLIPWGHAHGRKEGLRYAQVEPLAHSRVTTNLSCSAESISHVVLEFSKSISHVVLEGRGATLLQEHHWQQLYYPKDCVKTCNL